MRIKSFRRTCALHEFHRTIDEIKRKSTGSSCASDWTNCRSLSDIKRVDFFLPRFAISRLGMWHVLESQHHLVRRRISDVDLNYLKINFVCGAPMIMIAWRVHRLRHLWHWPVNCDSFIVTIVRWMTCNVLWRQSFGLKKLRERAFGTANDVTCFKSFKII